MLGAAAAAAAAAAGTGTLHLAAKCPATVDSAFLGLQISSSIGTPPAAATASPEAASAGTSCRPSFSPRQADPGTVEEEGAGPAEPVGLAPAERGSWWKFTAVAPPAWRWGVAAAAAVAVGPEATGGGRNRCKTAAAATSAFGLPRPLLLLPLLGGRGGDAFSLFPRPPVVPPPPPPAATHAAAAAAAAAAFSAFAAASDFSRPVLSFCRFPGRRPRMCVEEPLSPCAQKVSQKASMVL